MNHLLIEVIASDIRANNKAGAIEVYSGEMAASLGDATEFIESIVSGRIIDALIIHRRVSGLGLYEARCFVEPLLGKIKEP